LSFLKEFENTAGFEFRCFSHQAIFTEKPGFAGMITGIVPNPIP
jgi:hypothetical protein